MNSSNGKVKAFALVRDKSGKPKIDNIKGIPNQIWDLLTDDEKTEVIKNGGYALRSN